MPTKALKDSLAEWSTRRQMDGYNYLYIRFDGGAVMLNSDVAAELVHVIGDVFPELFQKGSSGRGAN